MADTVPRIDIAIEEPATAEIGASAAFAAGRPQVELPVRIRAFNEPDKNLILSSWLKSYRDAPEVVDVPNELYFSAQQMLIGYIASQADVMVACAHDNPDEILGWVCYQKGPQDSLVLHFVYVKKAFRCFGLGTKLMTAAGWVPGSRVWASHRTIKARGFLSKFGTTYNPYMLKKGF